MREYRSELCETCYLGRLFESEIIKPCDLCDGELCWIDENCDVEEEFKENQCLEE